MEIFKYINQKMEIVTSNLIEQNDFISDEVGDYSKDMESVGDLDDYDELDLFNESQNESKHPTEKSQAEQITDSFNKYFGFSEAQERAKMKAKKQHEEYVAQKSRRESARYIPHHSGIDSFLGLDEQHSHYKERRHSNVSAVDMEAALLNVNSRVIHKNSK
jgi:ethanolamine ammonia-lyase small subunit